MFMDVVEKMSSAGKTKEVLLKTSKGRYLVSAALAGFFVGIGVIVSNTVGGTLSAAEVPYVRMAVGASFAVALSLVLMCGAELYTGNNVIMTIASLNKRVSWITSINVWIYGFIGNLLGSLVIAFIYARTGLNEGAVGNFIIKASEAKMALSPEALIMRGILCNIMVCLAIWCYFKLQSEAAKLIIIFWCLFTFVTSGFEHSVANMTLFAIALLNPASSGANLSLGGYVYNVALSSVGNLIGGIVFVGLAYWYVSNENVKAGKVNSVGNEI
jgi:nitrite transporter